MQPLTHWFSSHLLNPFSSSPTTVKETPYLEVAEEISWDDHIKAVDKLIKTSKIISIKTQQRLNFIRSYMVLRRNGRSRSEASRMVAEMFERGCYFKRMISVWTNQWIENRWIPHSQQRQRINIRSFLDDEDVEMVISEYLRNNKFTVTPKTLKMHIEKEILPTLGCYMTPKTISVETIRTYLIKKGWRYGLRKKGIYVDGHEREDVVRYREVFLRKMLAIEAYTIGYNEDCSEEVPNQIIENGYQRHIIVTHDESAFQANDDLNYGWAPEGEQPLRKKSRGRGLMVSEFLTDTVGRLAIPEDLYKRLAPECEREAMEVFEYGKNNDGYWTGENVINQV
jgi:hypothetical protein